MENNTEKELMNNLYQCDMLAQAEIKIKQAKETIKIAVVIHLVFTAILALILAYSYSDNKTNLIRSAEGGSFLALIIPVFIAGSALALLWMYNRIFHTIHTVIYILLGGFFYLYYIADCMGGTGDAVFAASFLAPFAWAWGLVPFIVCGAGRKSLTNAIKEYEYYAHSSPTEDKAQP